VGCKPGLSLSTDACGVVTMHPKIQPLGADFEKATPHLRYIIGPRIPASVPRDAVARLACCMDPGHTSLVCRGIVPDGLRATYMSGQSELIVFIFSVL
jgi:hypothetical protein